MSVARERFGARPIAGLGLAAAMVLLALLRAGEGHAQEPTAAAAVAFGFGCCLLGVVSFFVCRKYPGSALWVLILGNALGVAVLVFAPAILKRGEWAFITAVWLAATVTAFAVVAHRRRS